MQKIRLMNDYTVTFPVWRSDGLSDVDDWPQLPHRLVSELQSWAKEFNVSYDYETGSWPNGFDVELYFQTGMLLCRRLQAALGPGYEVELKQWESNTTRPS